MLLKVGDSAKLDLAREARTGIPEVVLAEGKRDADLVAIVQAFVAAKGRVLVSRLAPERLPLLGAVPVTYHERARLAVAGTAPAPSTGGRVLVLAAGTADVEVAEEARIVAQSMGCETRHHYDVGVAGIHRLFPALDDAAWADAVVVVAGREGAIAPVVAGLVDRPVIGIPVSVGYGAGGRGEAALLTMLQSCSPLTVVNIDAGFVGGACAAQIANRVASARNPSTGESQPLEAEVLLSGARRE
ncbi:MAG TPA: nickel pincer cofactor biosynthesis protein LarB [Candidatus Thermoplasmatota archaeon]|nr:nickel pincer cofactor biosynthesis protein LarB [Candidatus Thermoplasmatota archaeon]